MAVLTPGGLHPGPGWGLFEAEEEVSTVETVEKRFSEFGRFLLAETEHPVPDGRTHIGGLERFWVGKGPLALVSGEKNATGGLLSSKKWLKSFELA